MNRRSGLTLVEIVIVVAIIAVITGVYFLVANPAGQLASSRNSTRTADLQSIMIAVRYNIAAAGDDQFSCSAGSIPTSTENMGSASGSYNIAACLSTIISVMPFDPSASSAYYTSNTNYNTGYSISINSSTGQVTLSAPHAELGKTISVTQ
jgi:prepilin-type N-terminal cleavage/methylation domain-containing protein